MRPRLILAGLASGALAVSGLAALLPGATAAPVQQTGLATHTIHVCPTHVKPGQVTCFAIAVAYPNGKMMTSPTQIASAMTPADIQKAYGLTGLKSHGATVGIVDAYGYSGLEADLKVFRSTYDLPPCTIKNGCLKIVNQNGGTKHLPADNPGWDLEQALDVDMVSSACPDCNIVVVQGKYPSLKSLGKAVDTAVKLGAVAVSNSYGGGDHTDTADYDHPGVAITASTGDDGYQGGSYPASGSTVVAIGGTTLVKDSSKRGFTETAWSGAGSGCSRKNPQMPWQTKKMTSCKTKAMADVSGPANPGAGGLNIYYSGAWRQVGGTSESSPMIASVYALSGNTKGYPAKYPYAKTKYLYDITSGSNGSCGAPLCTSGKGWDGPTGIGSPHGVKGF